MLTRVAFRDVVSKEIFFQDNILFVEGKEDVALVQDEFQNTDINLFGYGVGGYGNFEVALKLANDLGIKKAAFLIDGSNPFSKDQDEDKIRQKLEKENWGISPISAKRYGFEKKYV